MKKISVILIALFVLSMAGCASTGGGGGAAPGEPFTVDLGTVKYATWTRSSKKFTNLAPGVKNTIPIGAQYDGVIFTFDTPDNVAGFQRITVTANVYDADNKLIPPKDGNAMIVVFYDVNGDLEGPEMGAGKNTPLKEFNLGGFSGTISSERGTRINLNEKPGGVIIQAASAATKFIELTEITFHG